MTVICKVCGDTHWMLHFRGGEVQEQMVMCTHCPVPCPQCRGGGGKGAYCASTPCPCSCHERKEAPGRGECCSPPRAEPMPTEEEIRLILARAGVGPSGAKVLLSLVGGAEAEVSAELLRTSVISLLLDSAREAKRWAERVRLLERRAAMAKDILDGAYDGEG